MKSKTTKAAGKASIDPMVGKRMMCHRSVGGPYIQHVEVILMAVSGTWAMVRHPRCMPFVCEVKELDANAEAVPRRGSDVGTSPLLGIASETE